MSQLEVNKVIPQSGTTLTLGESGDTVSVPSGATLDASNATLTLPDGSVTAAKLDSTAVDNTNTNSTVITGQTAETSIDGADSILIYDDSATALRKMTRTNFVAGIGGTNTPAFFVYKSSTQTLSDAAWTLITFDTEQIDTDNAFASNTFTVPSGQTGTYVIGAYVEYNGGASNLRDTGMEIRINGTVQARQQSYFEASYPSRQPQRIEKVVSLGAGDTVTIYGLLNVGSGTCQALGEDKGTNFYGYKIIE